MKIYIEATIERCDISTVRFKRTKVEETYDLGAKQTSIPLPHFRMPANCDSTLEIESAVFFPIKVPKGYSLQQLINYDNDEKVFIV